MTVAECLEQTFEGFNVSSTRHSNLAHLLPRFGYDQCSLPKKAAL
jgi:hypothetical protein